MLNGCPYLVFKLARIVKLAEQTPLAYFLPKLTKPVQLRGVYIVR